LECRSRCEAEYESVLKAQQLLRVKHVFYELLSFDLS
jgi:hypothetical protein